MADEWTVGASDFGDVSIVRRRVDGWPTVTLTVEASSGGVGDVVVLADRIAARLNEEPLIPRNPGDVYCPVCAAQPGKPCEGRALDEPHSLRRSEALRTT